MRYDWIFRGFFPESAPRLRGISPLPEKPICYREPDTFHPEWLIRINYRHILLEQENYLRLPEAVRHLNNLPLMLQAAVLYAQAIAWVEPTIVPAQIYCGQTQYLLPICLEDMRYADLAMTLSPESGVYIGNTCLTPEMAYHNARLLSRPTTPWLARLVEPSLESYAFPYEKICGMQEIS